MNEQQHHSGEAAAQAPTGDVQRRDDAKFQAEATALIKDAEETRLSFMERYRMRGFVALNVSILSLLAGAGGFGWYLLVQYNIIMAVACMIAAIILPAALHIWAASILKAYTKSYKSDFMPKMAKAIGGLKFFPSRGISAKIVDRTGIIPAYKTYEAEDCFMGLYKGVKVLFSEARLYSKKKETVFDGIFVLLETPGDVIEGHTVITANQNIVKQYAGSRWKNLQRVDISTGNHDWDRFDVYSDSPEAAGLLVGERLLKELAEAADIFDQSPLSAVLFRKKYVFIAIPYEHDMFEASNVHVPVATKEHALQCKREVEQILEVIDVFELYQNAS